MEEEEKDKLSSWFLEFLNGLFEEEEKIIEVLSGEYCGEKL